MSNITTVTGDYRDDVEPNGSTSGTGLKIGDGYILTAGHVVFEWNRSTSSPLNINDILDGPNTVPSDFDFRGFRAAYLSAAQLVPTSGVRPDNGKIEAGLVAHDTVIIQRGGNGVGKDDQGLVAFIAPTDMLNLSATLGSGVSIWRKGNRTHTVTGTVSVIDSKGAGTMDFTGVADIGDSGAPYFLTFDGKDYVLGSHSSQRGTLNSSKTSIIPNGDAIGTYFSYNEWEMINSLFEEFQTGNVTQYEPTNMVVGSIAADSIIGSGRADILLGRAGEDYLDGGDNVILSAAQIAGTLTGGQVWADDQLYGGADNDTLDAGMGSDLLHGGDRVVTGGTATAINADGVDSASYFFLSLADADKGVVIHIRESASLPTAFQTYSATSNFAAAVFVEDLGRDQTVDTLISIEKITATDADDTLRIDTLAGSKLAGSNGQGGLLEVDLGNQASTNPEGDILDMSRLEEGAVVNWDSQRILSSFASSGSLTVRGVETLKATKMDDTITVSATGVRVRGAGGNDAIDATAGSVDVAWLKGDGLDTIATNYGSVDISALTIANYETTLQSLPDPRGVTAVNFSDMNKSEAELVLKNLTLIDQATPGGTTYYLYTADVYILEAATGKGINLGKAVASSSHHDLNFSAGYLHLFNLPEIIFADGGLSISEGGPNIAFRIDNGAQQRPFNLPVSSDPDIVSVAPWAGFEHAGFREAFQGRSLSDWFSDNRTYTTGAQQSELSDQFAASARSAQLLAQALSAFGHSSGPDEGAFSRTHEQHRDIGLFVNQRFEA